MTQAVALAQQASTGVSQGFKNRIINGAMTFSQRNGTSTVTPADTAYTLDRWQARLVSSSKFSVAQSSTTPAGFSNSLLVTSLAATSLGVNDYYFMNQHIEGFNVADLGWGTANAKTVTVSFWVRSSVTGLLGGALQNNGSGRSYPFSYSVSAANTWEYKTITIPGDTSGTWLTNNGTGIQLRMNLGSGSNLLGTSGVWASADFQGPTGATSIVGTNGATWYITGVQLEVGSTATSFDYRPYGTELSLCYRYFQRRSSEGVNYGVFATGGLVGGNVLYQPIDLLQTMRSAPSMSSTAANTFRVDSGNVAGTSIAFERITTNAYRMNVTTGGGITSTAGQLFSDGTNLAYIDASAEL